MRTVMALSRVTFGNGKMSGHPTQRTRTGEPILPSRNMVGGIPSTRIRDVRLARFGRRPDFPSATSFQNPPHFEIVSELAAIVELHTSDADRFRASHCPDSIIGRPSAEFMPAPAPTLPQSPPPLALRFAHQICCKFQHVRPARPGLLVSY